MENDGYVEPSTSARVLLVIYIALLALLVFLAKTEIDYLQLTDGSTSEQLQDSIRSLRNLIHYLLIVTVLQAMLFSPYFVLLGYRSIKTGRFPPQGTRVIKRTRIVQGKKATQSAYVSFVFALVTWLLVLFPLCLEWMLTVLS
jgi:hypothetical protein